MPSTVRRVGHVHGLSYLLHARPDWEERRQNATNEYGYASECEPSWTYVRLNRAVVSFAKCHATRTCSMGPNRGRHIPQMNILSTTLER